MNVKPCRDSAVTIQTNDVTLQGNLTIPEGAAAIVLFVHGSGSSRHSPRNRFVAEELNNAGLATPLFDLLTAEEEQAVCTRPTGGCGKCSGKNRAPALPADGAGSESKPAGSPAPRPGPSRQRHHSDDPLNQHRKRREGCGESPSVPSIFLRRIFSPTLFRRQEDEWQEDSPSPGSLDGRPAIDAGSTGTIESHGPASCSCRLTRMNSSTPPSLVRQLTDQAAAT
jgi:hypothetical protein